MQGKLYVLVNVCILKGTFGHGVFLRYGETGDRMGSPVGLRSVLENKKK